MPDLSRLASAFALLLIMIVPTADAQLVEDFNDSSLPTGWTVDDLLVDGSDVIGWDINVNVLDGGIARGNFTTGDAGAAHVDSDAFGAGAGAYNIALVSPMFDVWPDTILEFSHMFRSIDTGDFGYVEISHNGIDWATIFTVADTAGDVPAFPYDANVAGGELVTVDLNPWVGPNRIIRFRYEGDSWDWYWQVDNVSTYLSTIFSDGFESGDTTAWN